MKGPTIHVTVCFFFVLGMVVVAMTRTTNDLTAYCFSQVHSSILSSVAGSNSKNHPIPFRWDYLENRGLCGADKCFFRDIYDESIGYLISRNNRDDDDQAYVHPIHEGYKLACYLQQAYGIHHFLSRPPFSVNVTTTLINAHLRNRHPKNTQRDMYTDTRPAVVQMVGVAPPSVMFLKSNLENSSIVQKLNVCMKNHMLANVTERLAQDLQITLDILNAVPLLANDFQIMMDCNSGAVYHLDFDRFVGGIFHGNFADTFPKRHANAVRTIQVALDWTKQKKHDSTEIPNSEVLVVGPTKLGDLWVARCENKKIDEAASYVDFRFRWKGHKMHHLARSMMMDYVQNRWQFMQQNSDTNQELQALPSTNSSSFLSRMLE